MAEVSQEDREEIKTCPASRHAMMIAKDLQNKGHPLRRLLADAGYEPEHMGNSIQVVVESLWEARRWLKWETLPPTKRYKINGHWVLDIEAIEERIRADEREACAKVADQWDTFDRDTAISAASAATAVGIAAAIRAGRG